VSKLKIDEMGGALRELGMPEDLEVHHEQDKRENER
jgi:hypothetical protein